MEDKNTNTQLYHTNHTLSQSTATPKMMDIDDPQAPYFDFLEREKIFINEKKKYETAVSPTPSDSNVDNETGLDIIILWETALETGSAESIILVGQQNICSVSFLSATVDKSISTNNGLRFSIESPRKVVHDFNEEKYGKIGMHLANCFLASVLSQ
jgi:hypothetical protein